MNRLPRILLTLFCVFVAQARLRAQDNPAEWTNPFPPFRIAANLYYVGSEDLAAFLVVTPQGDILLNSNLASSPAQIQHSVEALGFHFKDIKILLISHAHVDHCAGSAEIKKMTNARYCVMDADVPVVQSGGHDDFQYGDHPSMQFPATHVDRVLHDGDTVSLGGTTLTARKTAGHTKGTTTWTLEELVDGKMLHVVIVGSPNVNPGYKLTGSPRYPQIGADYEHQFAVLRALPCDIFLGAHGSYFDMKAKYQRWKQGDRNAFIDPAGYRAYIADRERAFREELQRQTASSRH